LESRLPHEDTALSIVESGLEATLGIYRRYSDAECFRAREALAALGIEHLAERTFGVMSQGEKQRVLIARALFCEPALLVLDEPCAGLDPNARGVFLEDLGRLAMREDAPTMLLVTHHIEEIGPWISQVCALREGRVVAQGAPEELLTADVLSKTFAMECRVDFDGERYWLRPSLGS
jgi:iron complex transport system ATP-binding protein